MTDDFEMVTVRLPRWALYGIIDGIERWTGRQMGDIQILDVMEIEEEPE